MAVQIPVDADEIAAFCRRHHVRKLALFGSVLRDDFSPTSDVDVLVEFESGHIPGFNIHAESRGVCLTVLAGVDEVARAA